MSIHICVVCISISGRRSCGVQPSYINMACMQMHWHILHLHICSKQIFIYFKYVKVYIAYTCVCIIISCLISQQAPICLFGSMSILMGFCFSCCHHQHKSPEHELLLPSWTDLTESFPDGLTALKVNKLPSRNQLDYFLQSILRWSNYNYSWSCSNHCDCAFIQPKLPMVILSTITVIETWLHTLLSETWT
jgi:hypothetical protein